MAATATPNTSPTVRIVCVLRRIAHSCSLLTAHYSFSLLVATRLATRDSPTWGEPLLSKNLLEPSMRWPFVSGCYRLSADPQSIARAENVGRGFSIGKQFTIYLKKYHNPVE
eukprot:scaffold5917_cov31-Tisochrysis_lutea.AAC.3